MDEQAAQQGPEQSALGASWSSGDIPSIGMSRRKFAKVLGGGSAAAGLAWAGAPRVSTIRFAAKAVVGSPPPKSSTTTTSTTTPVGPQGTISVSTSTACGGDHVTVRAEGFVPKTAVVLELDSSDNTLGVTTSNGEGEVDVAIQVPEGLRPGTHHLVVTGVRTGGRTLTLRAPIVVRSQADCEVAPESSVPPSSTTTPPSSVAPTTTPAKSPTSSPQHELEHPSGTLAFTGTDAVNLALVGAAAAVGGRALYGLARRDDDEADTES